LKLKTLGMTWMILVAAQQGEDGVPAHLCDRCAQM
jgi:hypothetical protein